MGVVVSMSIIRDIILEASFFGASISDVLAETQMTRSMLDESDRWVGLDQAHQVWATVVKHSKDSFLGLKIGPEYRTKK